MAICYGIHEPAPSRNPRSGRMVEKDFSSAARYGTIKWILDQDDKPSVTASSCMQKVAHVLKDFRPEDYVFAAGGDPLAPLLVGAVLARTGFREVQFLRWERDRKLDGERTGVGFYVPSTVVLW